MRPMRWDFNMPHRCPLCHVVAVQGKASRWGSYTCCRCGTEFARFPRFPWPRRGVVCPEHRKAPR